MAKARPTKRNGSGGKQPGIAALSKVPTGIRGFDDVTQGGLPEGRTSLVCGAAGCGKTLFGIQFLVRGALDRAEPGVFLAFEETESDLAKNVASLGFDLADLERRKLLGVEHIHVERNEIEENGDYDLEGLFIRIGLALDAIGAKRLVIDTLETIFGGLTSYGILRSELRRLFRWLKDRGVTTIVTAERGDGTLTRHGLEEYVSDCVVLLDHRVTDQVSTRRLRVVKYRGSTHGSNEYPFLIDRDGLTVVPITTSDLEHRVSEERVSSGIPGLDQMLGGAGFYRGSTVLVSGSAGAGKSSLSAHFAAASCKRGERCLYVSYEESPKQIERNMRTIGVELAQFTKNGLLRLMAHRPTSFGLEGHLALLHKRIADQQPRAVVIDPIGTMSSSGSRYDAHLMLVRLVDFLKNQGITALLTNLTHGGEAAEATDIEVSSLVDTWIVVKGTESNGERTRGVYVLKSRGMNHSNQVREFLISSRGVELREPYIGPEGVLIGTARTMQEARELTAMREREAKRLQVERLLGRKRALLEQRIAEMQAEFAAEEVELLASARGAADYEVELASGRDRMSQARGRSGNGEKVSSRLSRAAASMGNGKRAAARVTS